MKNLDSLKQRWTVFLAIVLDPWAVTLLIATLALVIFYKQQSDPLVNGLTTLLMTMATAILGGRITQQWTAVTESSVLRTRGKSAVGSLRLLLGSIHALEKRTAKFLGASKEGGDVDAVQVRNFEEIVETCNRLEEETVHSIENWTDIVPEADIKTQIGVISYLKAQVDARSEERNRLVAQLESAKGDSEQAKKELREQISAKDAELDKLRVKITSAEIAASMDSLRASVANLTDGGMLAGLQLEPGRRRARMLADALARRDETPKKA